MALLWAGPIDPHITGKTIAAKAANARDYTHDAAQSKHNPQVSHKSRGLVNFDMQTNVL
jgi:hypothetical protein